MRVHFRDRKQGELNLPLIYLIITVVLAATGFVLYRLHAVPVLLCPFKELTGHPCPTCGTTRVVFSLFEMDLLSAIGYNPGLVAFMAAMCIWFLYGIWSQWKGRALVVELRDSEWRWLRIVLLVLFLVNWAYLWWAGI